MSSNSLASLASGGDVSTAEESEDRDESAIDEINDEKADAALAVILEKCSKMAEAWELLDLSNLRLSLDAQAQSMSSEIEGRLQARRSLAALAKRFKKDCGAYVAESSSEGAAGASSSSSSSSAAPSAASSAVPSSASRNSSSSSVPNPSSSFPVCTAAR